MEAIMCSFLFVCLFFHPLMWNFIKNKMYIIASNFSKRNISNDANHNSGDID